MVRLKDIAERVGLSVMTISKALRDMPDVAPATRDRIKAVAQQLGYVPDSSAQELRTRKSHLFGLILSSLGNPIFGRVLLSLEERAQELGYDLLLGYTLNSPEREETCIRRFLSRRVDGLFISPVYNMSAEKRVYQELIARKVPTVVLGHNVPFCAGLTNVESDDLAAGYDVTRHLLSLGHKRIAFLTGPPATPWTQERFEGYRRALREAGLDVDDKLVFQAGRTIEDGAQAALQMIGEAPDVTAVQAINDLVAIGCANVLLQQGVKIPEELSITGFGNTVVSEFFLVPLTTISQPKYRLGEAAMHSMLQLLKGQQPEPKRISAELVVRASSGTAPATPVLKRLKSTQK